MESIRASIPLDNISNIVKKATDRAFAEERIRKMCCDAYIDGVGTVDHSPYYVRFFVTLNRIKGELKEKTIDSMKECLVSELSVEIKRHINLELQSKLHLPTVALAINQISGMMLVLIASVLNPIAGVVVAVATGLFTFLIGQDVNSRLWRESIVMEIFEEVSKHRAKISMELSSHLWKTFHAASDHLNTIAANLEDYSRRIAYTE